MRSILTLGLILSAFSLISTSCNMEERRERKEERREDKEERREERKEHRDDMRNAEKALKEAKTDSTSTPKTSGY